ncbi:MAG: CRISPR-associated endonuclease Cas2 [Gammaproteobacteria bacterium]|jgi:CRISPR-associated endoribonuclease Cas2
MTVYGGYRTMWVFAMFDLPTDTPAARKAYADFRKQLLKDGFTMLQFSVYARHCPSEENAGVHMERVKSYLPADGEVRLLTITDAQFGRMQVYHGRIRAATECAPEQVSFF